jgi:hypothetical protein
MKFNSLTPLSSDEMVNLLSEALAPR